MLEAYWVWGGIALRISIQRRQRSRILPTIGIGVAAYVVCAVGYHWLVEPTLAKNPLPSETVVQSSEAAFAARAKSVPLPPVASSARASTAVAVKAAGGPAAKVTAPAQPTLPAMAAAPAKATTPTKSTLPAMGTAAAMGAAPAPAGGTATAPAIGDTAATAAAAPDTMEQTEVVEQKKPTRKRAAQRPREPQNFFNFFFNQSNSNRPNTSRSNTAQSNGFRPFF